MRPTTPNLRFSKPAEPSSPPETPTSPSFTFGKNNTRAPIPNGAYNFSRPYPARTEGLEPIGGGNKFRYNPSMRPEDISPRSSSPSSDSSDSSDTPPRSLSSEREEPEILPQRTVPARSRIVAQGNFTIEELRSSDVEYDSDDALSVVQPDHYEDAESDCALERQPFPTITDMDTRILADNLERLDCNNHSEERDAWLQKERRIRRAKRMSAGSIKRTLSQSIGSDTDEEDLGQVEANEAGSSARRLRRRTGDRASLIFDNDPPQIIVELDEPESGDEVARMQVAEPDVDVDVEELGLHSLPYYEQDTDSMEVDSDSD